MGERPTAAFILSLIGGALIALQGIIAEMELVTEGRKYIEESIKSLPQNLVNQTNLENLVSFMTGVVMIVIAIIIIIGIVVVIGALQIRSGVPKKVRTWSIVVLVLSIIGLITRIGYYIGPILGLAGGILGLMWKPSKAESATPTPSPQAPTT